jgi:hypothetical protein
MRWLSVADRFFIPAVVVAAIAAYISIYAGGLADTPVRSDGFEYYVYAPAIVIHHDPTLERLARDCCAGTFPGPIGILRWPSTGRLVDRHTMGVALLVLPFFVAGHLLTLWSNMPRDGFSQFYAHASGIAAIFYLAVGLLLLKRQLRRFFEPAVVLVTLASIVLGTNLFHYATYDSLFSHVYTFFLVCCLLHLTARWYTARSFADSLAIGIVIGLIVLVRAPNVVCLLIFVLYGVTNRRSLRQRIDECAARWPHLLAIAAIACAIQVPQLALSRWATGAWFVNPYGSQWFHFGSPKIIEVLFSPEKGLFFWSPILLVSLIGFVTMFETVRPLALGIVLFVASATYLIASWDDWQFGGSYGHRAFTDLLPAFAFAMAAGYERLTRRPGWTPAIVACVALAVSLSIVQMIQYWIGIIPFRDTSWDMYRSVFLRFSR